MDPGLQTPLCDVCKAMLASINDPSTWITSKDTKRYREIEGPHQKSTKSLLVAAAWGCGICARLKERLSGSQFPAEYSQPTDGHPWLKYAFSKSHGVEKEVLYLRFWDWYTTSILESFTCQRAETEQVTDQNDLRNLSSVNTGDEEVFERARSWLSDCVSHHPSCEKHAQPDYHPPRLLSLGEDSVRLLETHGNKISGRYATLSYCWGRNPVHLTLTTHNIDTFRKGFKTSHLSKTFREALQVTRSPGIQLLWIDALCILQSGEGHVEDWQNHLTEMAVIYVNCVLNITVDHGQNAEAGCFMSRDPDTIKPCIIEVSPVARRSTTGSPAQEDRCLSDEYCLINATFWGDLLRTPLVDRGWVYQERLLSPRIIHFGNTQLVWECTELMACETFPTGPINNQRNRGIPFSSHGSTSYEWFATVAAYSKTSLTNLQDKLPAIAGIAKRVSTERAAKYVAGLFLCDLPKCLLWKYVGGPLGGIVTPYRAPSWSWASREGNVSFDLANMATMAGMARMTATEGNFACIDDLILEYTDERNPFGQLKSGLMRITAPLFRIDGIDLEYEKNNIRSWWGKVEVVPLDFSNNLHEFLSFHGRLYLDESGLSRPKSGASMSLVFISYTKADLFGLIVEHVEDSSQPQRWMRIGVFHRFVIDPKLMADTTHILKNLPKTTLELV